MSLEVVRISQRGKEQLVKLKRLTGIKQWNVLCRWALCVSLSDPSPPLVRQVVTDSNIEMSWKTFGGAWAETYAILIADRSRRESGSTSEEDIRHTLSAHLHRGIGRLAEQAPVGVAELVEAAWTSESS
jgi:DNA sulfur modification protein DndE